MIAKEVYVYGCNETDCQECKEKEWCWSSGMGQKIPVAMDVYLFWNRCVNEWR